MRTTCGRTHRPYRVARSESWVCLKISISSFRTSSFARTKAFFFFFFHYYYYYLKPEKNYSESSQKNITDFP